MGSTRTENLCQSARQALDELTVARHSYEQLKAKLEVVEGKNEKLAQEKKLLEEEKVALQLKNELLENTLKETQSENEAKLQRALNEARVAMEEREKAVRECDIAQAEVISLKFELEGLNSPVDVNEGQKQALWAKFQDIRYLRRTIADMGRYTAELLHGIAMRDKWLSDAECEIGKLRWICAELVQMTGIRTDGAFDDTLSADPE
ncbi:hypothetical protein NMY22_g3658 [Coprinellus aureogranulatus]|nr:hypothetical protein NMY22_g3658 [Coprinellus aureogranulatus]